MFSARQIMAVLEGAGFPCEFANTGGGVYAVQATVLEDAFDGLGMVAVGMLVVGSGEWNSRDIDTPVDLVSVGGECEHAYQRGTGAWDLVEFDGATIDGEWADAYTLDEIRAIALDVAVVVRRVAGE